MSEVNRYYRVELSTGVHWARAEQVDTTEPYPTDQHLRIL